MLERKARQSRRCHEANIARRDGRAVRLGRGARVCAVNVGLTCVDVWPSARKHGVDDEDMRHAVQLGLAQVELADDRLLIIGPARDGRLLEVVVADVDDEPVVIHAMPARRKWYRHLSPEED